MTFKASACTVCTAGLAPHANLFKNHLSICTFIRLLGQRSAAVIWGRASEAEVGSGPAAVIGQTVSLHAAHRHVHGSTGCVPRTWNVDPTHSAQVQDETELTQAKYTSNWVGPPKHIPQGLLTQSCNCTKFLPRSTWLKIHYNNMQ